MAKVAIMGYGTVGSGVYDIIKTNSDKLSRSANGESVDIKYILDIRDFDDHPEKELFTKEFNDILNDDEVSVVAEVMGGLHPAYEFTKSLLEAGKSVVTSNKAKRRKLCKVACGVCGLEMFFKFRASHPVWGWAGL